MRRKLLVSVLSVIALFSGAIYWTLEIRPDVWLGGAADLVAPPVMIVVAFLALILSSPLKVSRLVHALVYLALLTFGGIGYWWWTEVLPNANWSNAGWALLGVASWLLALLALLAVVVLIGSVSDEPEPSPG